MRRLLLLPLLVLAAACGDAGDGEKDGDTAGSSGEVAVVVTFDEPLELGPVTWTVTVVNGTDEALELSFGNGQRADVTLMAGGEEVYRWSRAQMFTQALGREKVRAGDELSFELEDHLEVDPGEYELTATVTTTGRELSTTRTVTVEGG